METTQLPKVKKNLVEKLAAVAVNNAKVGEQQRKSSKTAKKGLVKRTLPPLTDYELQQLGIRSPKLHINYNVFRKTLAEKEDLRNAKAFHNLTLRRANFDPRKRINVSEPAVMSSKI